MTFNVFGGTLNLTLSIYLYLSIYVIIVIVICIVTVSVVITCICVFVGKGQLYSGISLIVRSANVLIFVYQLMISKF